VLKDWASKNKSSEQTGKNTIITIFQLSFGSAEADVVIKIISGSATNGKCRLRFTTEVLLTWQNGL